ncbi:MAG: histidine phosphatase family protein [Streptosporangiales bacterium]
MTGTRTVVHLVRHGEVENPRRVLYGRRPDFHLSATGKEMAERVADWFAGRDLTVLRASPLERTVETATPTAERAELEIDVDDRLIEPWNRFEGLSFGVGDGSWRHPRYWQYVMNPFKPSWGEPYREVVERMLGVLSTVRAAAAGREAVCVTHQLPIEVTRRALTGQRLWHRPDRRQCSLASVTSLTYADDSVVDVSYAEPALAIPADEEERGA